MEARVITRPGEFEQVLQVRRLGFALDPGGNEAGLEDNLDQNAFQILIRERRNGAPVAAFRLLALTSGDVVGESYSAQFYDLDRLKGYADPMLEVGRFCTHPDHRGNADIIRLAWAMITAVVDETGTRMLFGCSSFHGTDGDAYQDTFALLRKRHLAPQRWRPLQKASRVYDFAQLLPGRAADPHLGLMRMPPLLRSYLSMGGWVSDHAVVDAQMNTLHVFTGLEVGAIPAARKHRLRALLAS